MYALYCFVVFVLVLPESTCACTPSRVEYLQEFCDVPVWFMPYGYGKGDAVVSENNHQDFRVEAPSYVKFTINGQSYGGLTTITFNNIASISVQSNESFDALEISAFDDKSDDDDRWDVDGVVGVIFVRGSRDPDLLERVSNIVNHGMGISGQLFPSFVADWLVVITYHCVRAAKSARPSTFQIVITFGQKEIYILYSFYELHLPYRTRPQCIVIGAGQYPVDYDDEVHLVDDDYYRFDPRHYTSMSNANRNGRWLQLIGRSHKTVTPLTQNMWTKYNCECGGCGTRSRVVDGRRETEYGACPYFEARPCKFLPREPLQVRKNKYGRKIVKRKQCCYDFREDDEMDICPPGACGPNPARRRRSVNAKSKPRLAQFGFEGSQISPYEQLDRPSSCKRYGGHGFNPASVGGPGSIAGPGFLSVDCD